MLLAGSCDTALKQDRRHIENDQKQIAKALGIAWHDDDKSPFARV
jgi:hypothetical protein